MMVYFFLSFLSTFNRPKIKVAVKEPKLIIRPIASATDKMLSLSSNLIVHSYAPPHFQIDIATIINSSTY